MGSCYIQDKFELSSDGGVISVGLRYDFLDPQAKRPMVELIPVDEDEYVGEVTEYVDASVKGAFSPRVGFSAPLSTSSFVFANIGMYRYTFEGEVIFLDQGALRLLDMEEHTSHPTMGSLPLTAKSFLLVR